MAALSQVARLPQLAGLLVPARMSVGAPAYSSLASTRYVAKKHSPLDSWAARDISTNPFEFHTIKYPYYGENQSPSYQDESFEVRGTVLDSASNPMERRVLLLTRDGTRLGMTRSNPDGTFKLTAWDYGLNRTLVVAIPDDGDVRNAVVKWGVIGTTPL